MSWKTNIQVRDMDDRMKLECTCEKCKKTYYLIKEDIIKQPGTDRLYIDEVEARCSCRQRGCNGKIDILLIEKHKRGGSICLNNLRRFVK